MRFFLNFAHNPKLNRGRDFLNFNLFLKIAELQYLKSVSFSAWNPSSEVLKKNLHFPQMPVKIRIFP